MCFKKCWMHFLKQIFRKHNRKFQSTKHISWSLRGVKNIYKISFTQRKGNHLNYMRTLVCSIHWQHSADLVTHPTEVNTNLYTYAAWLKNVPYVQQAFKNSKHHVQGKQGRFHMIPFHKGGYNWCKLVLSRDTDNHTLLHLLLISIVSFSIKEHQQKHTWEIWLKWNFEYSFTLEINKKLGIIQKTRV